MEEEEFLSNDEEEEALEGEQITRFFNAEDFQYLLCKSLSALDLKGPPQEVSPRTQTQILKIYPGALASIFRLSPQR